jgi:hypothetical protein
LILLIFSSIELSKEILFSVLFGKSSIFSSVVCVSVTVFGAFREPLVHLDQYGELQHTCRVSYRERLKPNTVTDTHTTEENMELLPNNTENSISLDNSMLENISYLKGSYAMLCSPQNNLTDIHIYTIAYIKKITIIQIDLLSPLLWNF